MPFILFSGDTSEGRIDRHWSWQPWAEERTCCWKIYSIGKTITGFCEKNPLLDYNKCPKILNTLFHNFWPKFCFLWSCFLKYLVEWQTVETLIGSSLSGSTVCICHFVRNIVVLNFRTFTITIWSASHNHSRWHFEIFFYYFSEKVSLDISCESSDSHEMSRLIFSKKKKKKKKKIDCRQLQILLGALRVKWHYKREVSF